MTLKMIYPSNHVKKGEAKLLSPDGTLVMSYDDFSSLTNMINNLDLNVSVLKKRAQEKV